MTRRLLVLASIAAIALAVPASSSEQADAQDGTTTLRIATLAPRGSSWMRVFNAWNTELRAATNDQVTLRFYPGGTAGDERDFIRKIRQNQMDGAAVTTTGLSQVVRPILVLAVPGVMRDYAALDRVRGALSDEFAGMFDAEDYKLLGWGDVGQGRIFSQTPVAQPSDIASTRPWAWRENVVFNEFLSVVGATPVRLGVPEVYPALQTGQVNAVPASAIAAVSLQWHTRVSHVTAQSDSVIIGATILRKSTFEGLSEAHRTALMSTAAQAHQILQRQIRRDDARAYQTIVDRGVTPVNTDPHRAAWETAARTTRNNLAGRLYPRDLLQRVERAAGN